ncbi:amidohydrolase [Kitasatospora sp. NBC_00374]|uniref:amidohydrolase family protein n=1 Tax=Kitasatospora sp. NBC_00374 TaxID=2975964 RepID=UPI0030DEE4AC
MWRDHQVVDTDGHIMEPLWLWPDYLDPAYRKNGLQVLRDPADGDKLLVNGRPSQIIRRLGGIVPVPGQAVEDWNTLPADGSFASYRDSCTSASWNAEHRVAWLDETGIGSTLLFPSLGLIWPREAGPDSPYTVAHFDAYNRWLLDMTADTSGRLLPVAQLAFTEGLVKRVVSLAEQGFRHVMLPTGIGTSLRTADSFFATTQDIGLTVHLHKVAIPHFLGTEQPTSLQNPRLGRFFNHVHETLPGQLFLTALLDSRVLDRFPHLRFAFHECNAGWLPAWIERAHESWETLHGTGQQLPDQPPKHYLQDRDTLFFSVGLGEDLAAMPDWLHRRIMLATDYPHPGTPTDPASAWAPALEALPHDAAAGLLSANAGRMMPAATAKLEVRHDRTN